MTAALIQMTSGDNPATNLEMARRYLQQAAAQGATLALTPEVTNCVSTSNANQNRVLQTEAEDITLAGLREEARALGIWVLIGSLALKTRDADGRFANRSFLIDPDGAIRARYDKIHMFDVQVSPSETYRESAGFRPGTKAVVAQTPLAAFGLSICYDLRFAHLYRSLAKAGAVVLTVPAAFSPITGAAHWETLLRARAIETGCFVLAPAQTGRHPASDGQRVRSTHGHSLAVAPWGEVLLDMGTVPGVGLVNLDLARVVEARDRVPALFHDRDFALPDESP
ncbi:carbon-nitrogen hydrolase family protein [Roseinatronobacter monicus]|uniref:carbon-nitrogen hydrolase family protein n=1 Tax=Roseinatronobacter monicus TaxID=393481 RepID=UPI00114F084D|nr:carbon-nitrogen hydrolase family protein [Roseinatronobacter monicus]